MDRPVSLVRLEAHGLIELEVVAVGLGWLLTLEQRGKVRWRELLRCKTHVGVLRNRVEWEMLVRRHHEAL